MIKQDGSLAGTFRSGRHYITNWVATRNADAALADPDTLTRMIEPVPLSFAFPDADGNIVSLEDPKYAGKPKLIKLMGTWCPNCRDEADFLMDYLANNDSQRLGSDRPGL